MNTQLNEYQPKDAISAKKLWFAYFIIFLFFNVFVLISEKYPNLLGYIFGVNITKDNINPDGSFGGFVELEIGTYDLIFYALLALSVVFLVIIFKISAQAKIDGTKDNKGSIRLQLAYLTGAMGVLLFLLHGELIKFIFFSAFALVGFLKTFPGKDK